MNYPIENAFANVLHKYEGARFVRLMHSPGRLLYSKYLELRAKCFGAPRWTKATTFWGDEMNVVFPEPVSMTIYRYKFFEASLTRMMLSTIKPGMVFFDIGAHFGYYSLLALKLVGDQGEVHSFEPTPSTFEVLQRNTSQKSNIRINNLAMWSKPDTLHFRDYGTTYSAFNSIQSDGVENNMRANVSGRECTVHATSVDEYARQIGKMPDFLKLDAEGAELNIASGMTETFRQARPTLTVEVGDILTPESGRSRKLLEAIIRHGYEPFEVRSGELQPHTLRDVYPYENILLKPVSA